MGEVPVTQREQLIAYLATLAALVVVFVAALVAAGAGVSITEAFAMGTITGGLIGVLRIPSQRAVTIDNPASNPVQPEDAGK